jgi:hypothetical protein
LGDGLFFLLRYMYGFVFFGAGLGGRRGDSAAARLGEHLPLILLHFLYGHGGRLFDLGLLFHRVAHPFWLLK